MRNGITGKPPTGHIFRSGRHIKQLNIFGVHRVIPRLIQTANKADYNTANKSCAVCFLLPLYVIIITLLATTCCVLFAQIIGTDVSVLLFIIKGVVEKIEVICTHKSCDFYIKKSELILNCQTQQLY